MTNTFLSLVIPQVGAQRLVEESGHFPADLVLSGMLNPDYALNVSRTLQEMEKQAIRAGGAETAANYDFLQQAWEQETGLAARGATADEDGQQDYWRDGTKGIQAYKDAVSGRAASGAKNGKTEAQAALEQLLNGPDSAACFKSLFALYALCCILGGGR